MGWIETLKRLLVLATICAVASWAHASRAEALITLDLEDCVERAVQQNPKVEEADLDVRIAQWKQNEAVLARTGRWDMMDIMGATEDAWVDGAEGDTIDGKYGYFNRLKVDVAIPIYTFGQIGNGIAAAEQNVAVEEAQRIKTIGDMVVDVHRLYYGLVLALQLHENTEELYGNFEEAVTIAEERLEEGDPSVTEADLLKLKVGFAGVTKGLRRLERDIEITREALRRMIGLEDQVDYALADGKLEPVEYDLRDREYFVQSAEKYNPQIRQIEAGLKAQKFKYLSEEANFYPKFLIVGGIGHAVAPGRDDPDNPYLYDRYHSSYYGGTLAIKWQPNIFQTNAEVMQEKTKYLRMRSRHREGVSGILLEVKEKYEKASELAEVLDATYEARKSGRGLLFLNFSNFKLGIGSGKDAFDALSIHARTTSDYFESVYDYNVAVARLENVAGLYQHYAGTAPEAPSIWPWSEE